MVKRRNTWIFAVLTVLVLLLMLIAGYAMKQMDAERFSMGSLSEPVLRNLIASAGSDKDIAGLEKDKESKVRAPENKTGSVGGGAGSIERGGKTGIIAVIRDGLPGGSAISSGGKVETPVTPLKPPVVPNDPAIPGDPVGPEEPDNPVGPADPQPEDGFVTGEIPEKQGYDVATVRYVFEDGSYEFADFSKVGGKYRYKFPKQQKKVKVVPEYFSTEKWDGAVDISWYDPEKVQYNISSGAQLAGLAAIVNGSVDRELPDYRIKGDSTLIKNKKMEDFPLTGAGGGDQKATVYKATGDTDFMGKTVHITADLDMGGMQDAVTGKWSGPNYTPIGGKYPMEISTGDYLIEAFFNGVLDGHGHKIINLNCNRYTEKGFAYSQAIGLVGYLGDVDKGKEMHKGWQPTVKNLSVEGYVYGRRMVGGIVGRVGNTAHGVRVENCANKANIFNTDSKGIGGVVGSGWGKGSILNCYNTGNVTTTYTSPAGGICGSNRGMDIYSCYSVGTVNTGEAKTGRGIGGHDGSTYEVDNCYYLEGSDDDRRSKGYYRGGASNLSIRVKALTGEQLKERSTLDNLNANGKSFYEDAENINGGYPVLFFEKSGPAEGRLYTVSLAQSDGGRVKASQEGKVPYGTVVQLSNEPLGGHILNCYKADGKEMVGRYYTVTGDVTLSADFIKLKKGKLIIGESKDCVVSLTKRGTVLDEEGNESWVVNRQVSHGDAVFEKDTLSAKAVLDQYAAPEDANKEYSGDFILRYTYRKDGQSDYNVTANRGVHTLTDRIEGAELIVTAIPMTKPKTWESQGDIKWYQNNEDAESYTIDTAEELAGLLYLVNEKSVTFEGKTILLGRNISLKNTDGSGGNRLWPGIGKNQEKIFKGVFDGQGHTISDMKALIGGSDCALFRFTEGGEIRNLTLRGEIRSGSGAGGIIGRCDGTKVKNCINYASVYDTGQYAGGIAGVTTGGAEITKCINRGDILGANGVGGIVGGITGKTDVVTDCVNYGRVEATGTREGCGGITGRNNGSVLRCGNYGDVSSAGWYVGGVVGYCSGSDGGRIIKSCYNKGNIHGKNNKSTTSVGGVVGFGQYIEMKNVFNTGKVSVEGEGSAHVGGVCGKLFRNLGNSITMAYYLDTSCPYGIDGSHNNLGLSYVDILSKTEEEIKEEAFVALLNGNAQGLDFQSANNDYPFLSWLNEKGAYLVTFQGDYTGSILVYEGGVAPLPQAEAGKTYTFTVNGDSWSGEDITSNVIVDVTEGDATYYATFVADGQMVAKVPFVYGTTSVTEPQLPEKPGCRGRWPAYTLGAGDVTIHGVYVRDAIQGGVHLDTDGYYYIGASSTGTITVAPGAQVTLDGEKRRYNNLNIHVKRGGILHMRDVYLSDESTVLTLEEGSTVILEGENTLQGAAMEAGNGPENINLSPTISVKGNVTVEGGGTLYTTAEAGNSCIGLADGATLEQKGGFLKIYKNTKLGIAGGAVHGPGGTIKISGGTFFPVAASDNLRSVNVKSLQVKGGEALVYTMDESIALAAQEIEVSGGLLKVVAREHDTHEYAYDGDAVDCPAFKEKYRLYSPDIGDMARPYQVMVDGQAFYNGHGVMADFSEKDGFISASDHKTYIWISKLAHTISIGGKTIDLGAEGE